MRVLQAARRIGAGQFEHPGRRGDGPTHAADRDTVPMLDSLHPVRERSMATAVAAVIALALALAVSGCSSDDPESNDTASSSLPTSADAEGSTSGLTYAQDPAAAIDAARVASAKDQRPVLLDFGADWCVDCVVLNELYGRSAVAPVLDQRYHVVKIDVGEFDKNLDVAAEYIDLDTSGIPALVVITPAGKVAFASNDGEFANASTMDEQQLLTFLKRWTDPA